MFVCCMIGWVAKLLGMVWLRVALGFRGVIVYVYRLMFCMFSVRLRVVGVLGVVGDLHLLD